jgi:hypothetical protein
MDNEEYINKITLEFLLNPVLQEKLCKGTHNDINLIKDIKFYRKRINQITKDMCRGEFIDETLKSIFINYTTTLIYYFKRLDEKDILQTEYNDLIDSTPSDISMNICSKDLDNLMINTPKPTNNLNNFVKKINVDVPTKILPQRRIVNTKDPSLKIKGVKKKNIS